MQWNCRMFLDTMTDITDIYDLGNYTGFFQTAYAVYLSVQQPERLLLATKWLYPAVAEHYGTTWTCVERNIRTVAGMVWSSHRERLEELAQNELPCKPSASGFLALLTMHFQQNTVA